MIPKDSDGLPGMWLRGTRSATQCRSAPDLVARCVLFLFCLLKSAPASGQSSYFTPSSISGPDQLGLAQEFKSRPVRDLAGVRVRFTYYQNEGTQLAGRYRFCTERDVDFLHDRWSGTTILAPWGGSSRGISGISFPFFGRVYTSAYVGLNGAISFGWPEFEPSDHFAQPRISGFLPGQTTQSRFAGSSAFVDDLSLTGRSSVMGQKLDSGDMVISYNDLQFTGELCCGTSSISFQVVLHTSGDVSITYGQIRASGLRSWVIGLSAGKPSSRMVDFLAAESCDAARDGIEQPVAPHPSETGAVPSRPFPSPPLPTPPPPVEKTAEQPFPPPTGMSDKPPSSLLAPTEIFSPGKAFDLQERTVVFSFKEDIGYSSTVLTGASVFPSGTGGDSNGLGGAAHMEAKGISFPFFGKTYNSTFVNQDGSITFGAPSTNVQSSIDLQESHFSLPRISALYTGAGPVARSSASWRVLGSGALVVTYLLGGKPGSGDNQQSRFQVTLAPSGQIQIAYKEVDLQSQAVVGLSAGVNTGVAETTDLFQSGGDVIEADVPDAKQADVEPLLIYIGVAVAGGLVIAAGLIVVCCCCRRRRQRKPPAPAQDVEEANPSAAATVEMPEASSSCLNSSYDSGSSSDRPSAPPMPDSYKQQRPPVGILAGQPSEGELKGKSIADPVDSQPSAPPQPREDWDNVPLQDDEDSNLCVWCLESTATHSFVPCGHRCVCAEHADLLCSKEGQRCPICREPISSSLRVYT